MISPIGKPNSVERERADKVLDYIITPSAKNCGYDTIRADDLSQPGHISVQIIQHLIEDQLVVADLTGGNPNVFYELAIRHVARKPVVQMIQAGQDIPFDLAPYRTIYIEYDSANQTRQSKAELEDEIHSVESGQFDADSPVSLALDTLSLRGSGNPLEKSSAEILSMLQNIDSKIVGITSNTTKTQTYPLHLRTISILASQIHAMLHDQSRTGVPDIRAIRDAHRVAVQLRTSVSQATKQTRPQSKKQLP